MKTKTGLLTLAGASLGIAASLVVYAILVPHESRHARRVRLRAAVMVDSGMLYDSGAPHVKFYDCTGEPCYRALTLVANVIDADHGYAVEQDDAGFTFTPKPSYYLDGGIAKLPDGGLFAPVMHHMRPWTHPTVQTRYALPVHDRDFVLVAATVQSDPEIFAVLGQVTPGPLDMTWYPDQKR